MVSTALVFPTSPIKPHSAPKHGFSPTFTYIFYQFPSFFCTMTAFMRARVTHIVMPGQGQWWWRNWKLIIPTFHASKKVSKHHPSDPVLHLCKITTIRGWGVSEVKISGQGHPLSCWHGFNVEKKKRYSCLLVKGELSENIPVSYFMFWITELLFFFFFQISCVCNGFLYQFVFLKEAIALCILTLSRRGRFRCV